MGLRLTACATLSALLLGACATQSPTGEEDFASKLISEKAAIAAGAQRDFAALLAEDYSTVKKRQAAFDKDVIDVDYIGNPKELVQSIASRYGMAYEEMGKAIDMRPINILMKGVTPDLLLANIGNQIHAAGDVILNRQKKTITIEYKNRDAEQRGG